MRKLPVLVFGFIILVALCFSSVGCTDKKVSVQDSVASDSASVDTTAVDTMENIIAQSPMPKAADELFDDFIFNFAANRKLQRTRIKFPLPVYQNGKVVRQIAKGAWKMEHFFMRQDYYTLIFDNMKQMNVVKDTTIDHVVIEKILFNIKTVKQYLFNRIEGQWMLTSVNYKPMYQNMNASFLKFYQRFAADSAFQVASMADQVEFTAPDPDDDFANMTGTITPDQWPMFKPGLIPGGNIYNILYGQKYTESSQKIFVIRGIANGLETELTFRRKDGVWKLVKFNS